MHFSLNFRAANPVAHPSREQVQAALAAVPGWTPTAGGWRYENPATRAEAHLLYSLTLITLRIPLPRPTFVAHEVLLPTWQALTGVGLVAPDPRHPANPDMLLENWAKACRAAVAAAAAREVPLGYCPPDQALAWWRYTTGRQALRLAWPSPDVVLPDLRWFRRRDSAQAVRVLIWPEDAGTLVIPACDYVVVKPDPLRAAVPGLAARGPRPPEERPGFLPLAAVLEALADAVAAYPEPIPHHLYRGGEAHPFRLRQVRQIPGEPAAQFAPLSPDLVQDVAPPAGVPE